MTLWSQGLSKSSDKLQVSAYEACDGTSTPLHTPKILETCTKSTPCFIQKASRCEKNSNVSYLSLSIKHKDLTRKYYFFYVIGSVVKIVCFYFLYIKDLKRIKKTWMMELSFFWCLYLSFFIKKETVAQVFSYEFCEFSKNNFLTEFVRVVASDF